MRENLSPIRPYLKRKKPLLNSLDEDEILKKRNDRAICLQMLSLLAFFCNFIFWYDDPRLSAFESALLGVGFVIYLVYMVNRDIMRILYVFTIYISFQKVLAGDFGGAVPLLNLTNILLAVIIGAWWSRSFLRGERVFQFHAIDFFIIVYTLLLTVALLRGEYMRGHGSFFTVVTHFKRTTEVFFVYFLFVNNVKTRDQVKHILFSVCVVMAAVGIMGVKQYYMDIGAGSWSNMDKNKITILTEQPNQLASFLCNYSFYLLAIFCLHMRKWWGVLAGITFLFCFQSVRVTFSRGGIIAFYIALVFALMLAFRFRFLIIAIPLSLVVFSFPEKVLGPRLYKSYVRLTNSHHEVKAGTLATQLGEQPLDDSAMSRLWIMQAGLTRLQEDSVSTFFGVGLGRFPREVIGRHPKVFYVDAHNQWLLILVECGSIALAAFWCTLAVCLWKAVFIYIRTRDKIYRAIAIGYISGLVGLFIANFFGSRMNSNEITHFHWIMTAVLLRVSFLVRREVAERELALRLQRREKFNFS